MTHVLGEKWDNPPVPPLVPYSVTFARQYLYDGARQRYLDRELDPSDWQGYLDEVLSETWSDYDGDSIYGDWTLDGTERMPLRSYEPGLATTDQLAGGGPENTMYLHTNALGSTMATSNQFGSGTFDTAYTAFGERITGPFQRYGFAGAWGYQSHEDFPYQHLGHRYYNPETGRFLQRDPIGIMGSLNVYEYAANMPTAFVDPSGLQTAPPQSDRYKDSDGHSNHDSGGIIVPEPSRSRTDDMRDGVVAGSAGVIDGVFPVPGVNPAGRATGTRGEPQYQIANLCASIYSYGKGLLKRLPDWLKKLRPPNPPPYNPKEGWG